MRDDTLADGFLTQLKDQRTRVAVFLGSGTRLIGYITYFDAQTVLLEAQLTGFAPQTFVYRRAIATVLPSHPEIIVPAQYGTTAFKDKPKLTVKRGFSTEKASTIIA